MSSTEENGNASALRAPGNPASGPSDAQHTPGPWTVDDSVFSMTGGELWILAKDKDGCDVSLAAVRPGCEEAEEIGDNAANARLIAAAPCLKSEMVRYLPVLERAEADPALWANLTEGLGIATANGYRAAIARAAKSEVQS